MKYVALLLLVLSGPAWRLLTSVRDRNAAVTDATSAYAHGDAGRAARGYETALLAQPQKNPDPRLVLNLAHAQMRAGQPEAAQASYGRLLAGTSAALGSVARQQLAVLTARRGEVAQALSLLRQALLLNPANAGARFDYETLSDYLARRPNSPQIAVPPNAATPGTPKASPKQQSTEKNQPAEKSGADHPGETNDTTPAPPSPVSPLERRPNPAGQPDNSRPNNAPGDDAKGARRPGNGAPQPLAGGAGPGAQRGLDQSTASPSPTRNGQSNRPGTDAATVADLRLQTQRERLQAMSLSPTQARQLLETLRAQEQQYLQQLTRPASQKPDPSKPTW